MKDRAGFQPWTVRRCFWAFSLVFVSFFCLLCSLRADIVYLDEDGNVMEAGTSGDFRFAVAEDNGFPVILGAAAGGKGVRLAYDTEEEGYADGEYAYQIFFYSLKTRAWTVLERTLRATDGQAFIDLGADAAGGYLYICPVTTPESNFVELHIGQ